jgi:hypothetical protein
MKTQNVEVVIGPEAVSAGKRMFRDQILNSLWKGRVMVVTVNETAEDIRMLPDLDDAIRGNRLK